MTNIKGFTVLSLLVAASAFACSKGGAPAEESPRDASTNEVSTDDTPSEGEPGSPTRPELTSEECSAQGGEIIGDIGDGRIYEEAYLCPSGQAPTGNIVAGAGSAQAVEGAVCCH